MSYRQREFDSDGLRPADAGYGCPQPRNLTPRRSRAIKKAIRSHHSRVSSRMKSRRGLGVRKYR